MWGLCRLCRDSLTLLMTNLNSTNPHYIRYIGTRLLPVVTTVNSQSQISTNIYYIRYRDSLTLRMTNLNSTNPYYIRYRDSLTTVCWWPISTIQILTTSGTETTLLLYAECWWVITHINSLTRERFTLVMNHFVLSVLTLWGGGGRDSRPPPCARP